MLPTGTRSRNQHFDGVFDGRRPVQAERFGLEPLWSRVRRHTRMPGAS